MSKTSKEDFLKYRIDMLENKILNLEKRLDSIIPNNNNINMELLQMVMSMVKQPAIENKVTCIKEIPEKDGNKEIKNENVDDSNNMEAFNFRRRTTAL